MAVNVILEQIGFDAITGFAGERPFERNEISRLPRNSAESRAGKLNRDRWNQNFIGRKTGIGKIRENEKEIKEEIESTALTLKEVRTCPGKSPRY